MDFYAEKKSKDYTGKSVSMDVLTKEGLCGVCLLHVVVHALHVVSN
jgi:hypothetical protein